MRNSRSKYKDGIFMKRRSRKSAFFLICVLILAAAAAWLTLPPYLEKRKTLARQNELLESIEQGAGEIAADGGLDDSPVDFYTEDESETNDPNSIIEALTEENPSVIVFFEESVMPALSAPVADSAIITGIGVLTIEKIDAKLPVTDGVTEAQLKVAVGHVPETAPIGGYGNAIIAGHRSYTYGHYFNRLGELEPGDIIKYMPKDGEEMVFEIYELLTVLPDDPAVYAEFPGEQILTLHTCTPIRVASHRLLVRARRILKRG
ncbi:MAG: class D sortase [Clostridiales bacterium]|jgi:sortase A|nr:class D sortase [Clostridiales bacterium]